MVNGNRIRQARELKGLTQLELANAVGTVQAIIAQYESGRYQPQGETIEEIAHHLGFPVAFFSKPDPPDFPLGSLLFRAHAKITSTEKAEVYRLGQVEFETLMFLSKRLTGMPLSLSHIEDEQIDYKSAAQSTRDALGASPNEPIGNLVKLVERSGAFVIALPDYFESCDAYSLWVNTFNYPTTKEGKRPVIVLSGGVPGDRLRFSVAHELGHLVLHHAIKGLSPEIEDEAHKFAAELLLPEEAMRQELTPPITLTNLSLLKPKWRVSIQALIMRAHDLEIISDRQYKYLFKQITEKGWRKKEPGEIPVEKPRAFRKMVESLYGDPINIQQFSSDFGVNPYFAKQLIDAYATKEEFTTNIPRTTGEGNNIISINGRKVN